MDINSLNDKWKRLMLARERKNVLKWQWRSLEKNRRLSNGLLYKNLEYTLDNIPFYRDRRKRDGLKIGRRTVASDLLRFPVMDKKAIRDNLASLCNRTMLAQSYPETSGGTTGELLELRHQIGLSERLHAVTAMQYAWAGWNPGELLVQLWGNEADLLRYGPQGKGIIEVHPGHYILNSFLLDEIRIERYRSFMNRMKPAIIVAYAHSIYEMSRHLDGNGLRVHPPKAVFTSAATLFPFQRAVIERVFQCPVFDRYGSREVFNIGSECEKHEGMHLDVFFHHTELLDELQKPVVREGQTGQIYVTLFGNQVMPLIRYSLGDTAVYTGRPCSCGRGLPLIKELKGRTVDFMINDRGQFVDGEFFTHLFYHQKGIEQFQLIQKKPDEVLVQFVSPVPGLAQREEDAFARIESSIKRAMGDGCLVVFRQVAGIALPPSGKKRFTICEINRAI